MEPSSTARKASGAGLVGLVVKFSVTVWLVVDAAPLLMLKETISIGPVTVNGSVLASSVNPLFASKRSAGGSPPQRACRRYRLARMAGHGRNIKGSPATLTFEGPTEDDFFDPLNPWKNAFTPVFVRLINPNVHLRPFPPR
jgi:hypothetical protein